MKKSDLFNGIIFRQIYEKGNNPNPYYDLFIKEVLLIQVIPKSLNFSRKCIIPSDHLWTSI